MSHILKYLIELLIEACSVSLLVGCSGVPSDVRTDDAGVILYEPECKSVDSPSWRTGPLCYDCMLDAEKPALCIAAKGPDAYRSYYCCNRLPDGGPAR